MENITQLISMAEASRITPYEQDYLSLMARRGMIRAKKVGNKWYTTVEWLNDYLEEKKPNAIIPEKRKFNWRKLYVTAGILALAVFLFYWLLILPNRAKKTFSDNDFITEEIVKVPNENGGYDTYRSGRIKESDQSNQ